MHFPDTQFLYVTKGPFVCMICHLLLTTVQHMGELMGSAKDVPVVRSKARAQTPSLDAMIALVWKCKFISVQKEK